MEGVAGLGVRLGGLGGFSSAEKKVQPKGEGESEGPRPVSGLFRHILGNPRRPALIPAGCTFFAGFAQDGFRWPGLWVLASPTLAPLPRLVYHRFTMALRARGR